jgi:hypothetical protein
MTNDVVFKIFGLEELCFEEIVSVTQQEDKRQILIRENTLIYVNLTHEAS